MGGNQMRKGLNLDLCGLFAFPSWVCSVRLSYYISLCTGFTSLLKAQESKRDWQKVLFVSAEEKQNATNSY